MQAACGRSSIIPSLRGGMLICLREANPVAGHKGTIHYYLLRSNLGKDLGATGAKGNGLLPRLSQRGAELGVHTGQYLCHMMPDTAWVGQH